MSAANQHIEVDGGILQKQASIIREIAAEFSAAANRVGTQLPGDAFGLLNQGIVVPLANAVAGRSRELLASAEELADRMGRGVDSALSTFSSVEQEAVEAFSKAER